MKILTLLQPWASLVGIKKIETRSWSTKYRGLLGIHASGQPKDKAKDKLCRDLFYSEPFYFYMSSMGYKEYEQLPFGKVLSLCRLVSVRKIVTPTEFHPEFADVIMKPPPEPEFNFGDYTRYRYGWELNGIVHLKDPIPARGQVILWTPQEELYEQIITSEFVNNSPKKKIK